VSGVRVPPPALQKACSTLIGGTAELIETVLESPTLDGWPIGADDSLAYDADHINKTA